MAFQIPRKIKIVNSERGSDPKLSFDNYDGYDIRLQIEHLVVKVNEVIEYLEHAPQIPNELPQQAQVVDGRLEHEHDWTITGRIAGKVFRECRICKAWEIRPN